MVVKLVRILYLLKKKLYQLSAYPTNLTCTKLLNELAWFQPKSSLVFSSNKLIQGSKL